MKEQPVPTTFDELEAAGWTLGAGASGYRRRYTTVGAYDVGAFSDGGGVYVERTDGAHHIDTADACALAARIAALVSGDATQSPSRSTTMPEISAENLRDMHSILTEAGIADCDCIPSETARLNARIDIARELITSLKAERDIASAALEEANTTNARLDRYLAMSKAGRAETFAALEKANETSSLRGKEVNEAEAERDIARAEVETLRARLAERPAPPDPRDPPVKTAAEEEATERLWGALFTLGGGINRVDFEGGIEGIADAVEEALGYNLAQLRKVTTERDRIESIAMEQFRRRLSGA